MILEFRQHKLSWQEVGEDKDKIFQMSVSTTCKS